MKKIIVAFATVFLLFLLGSNFFVYASHNNWENTPTPQAVSVVVCHKTSSYSNPYTKNTVSVHSVNDANGLNGHGNHSNDIWAPFTYNNVNYPGQGNYSNMNFNSCVLSSPSPSPTPSPSPSPTVIPSQSPTPTPTATPSPSPTPEETSTPTPTPSATPSESPRVFTNPSVSYQLGGPPQGPSCESIPFAPTITQVGRIDSDTVFARFTKVADYVDTYLVWYGTSEQNLPYNTFVKGEYVELNNVPNTHIWLKVAGVHESCVGPFSLVVDP